MSESDLSDPEDGQFYVEAIVGHKIVNGKMQYLLKWKGYDSSENSWEYEENLNCDELLASYNSLHDKEIEEEIEAEKNKKKKKSRKKSNNQETISKQSQQKADKQTSSKKKSKTTKDSSQGLNTEVKEETSNSFDHGTHALESKPNALELNDKSKPTDIKKERSNPTENKPIEDDYSDVIELNETDNEKNKETKNTIFLDNNTHSTTKQTLTKLANPTTSKSLNDSNNFEESIQPKDDFTNITDLNIISVISYKKNKNGVIMCDCLTDKTKIITIPVKQLKKINKIRYIEYLESLVINPF